MHVVGMRPKEQMVDPHTRTIVTVMQYRHARRNRPVSQLPGKAVRAERVSFGEMELPIAGPCGYPATPFPAPDLRLVDIRPESFGRIRTNTRQESAGRLISHRLVLSGGAKGPDVRSVAAPIAPILYWLRALMLLPIAVAAVLPGIARAQTVDYTVELLGSPSKTTGCVVRPGNLPDPACTPGAVFPNVPLEVLCQVGYTDTIRSVPASVRHAVLAAYGVADPPPVNTVEVDHLVPLGLNGSNDVENLFPQPRDPSPGYVQKDTIERAARTRACTGQEDLRVAQVRIAWYWPGYLPPSVPLPMLVAPDGEDELP